MSGNDRSFILLARLVRTQGRYGELIADILTDFPERFAERTHVSLLPPDASSAASEATVERHWLHKGRIVLKFAGIDSISEAERFAGWHVAVPRAERTPLSEDAVYIEDLIGCRVIDESVGGQDLGPVLDVARGEAGSADMLVLQQESGELLVPFAKSYLASVDLEARILRMRLPPGLTTINAPLTAEERAAMRAGGEKD